MMLWPGLEPKTPENIREFTHVPGWRRRVSLLISGNPNKSDGLRLVQVSLQTAIKLHGRFVNKRDDTASQHFFAEAGNGKIFKEAFDLFVKGALVTPELYIRCSHPGTVPKSGCELVFTHNGTRMKINFERTHRPAWRTVQHAILDLLARFSAEYDRLYQVE